VRGLVHSVAGGVGIGDSGGDYLLESHSYQSSLQQQQQQGNRYGGGNGLSDVAKKHVLLVAKFNRNDASRNGQVSSSSMTSFCAEFEAVAESVKDGTYAAGKYLDTWRLLGDMLQYDTTDASLSAEQKVTLRARGALSYLCSQFKEMVVKRSRKMALSDSNERGTRSNGIPGSLVDDVATYVRSEIGISRSGGFLWPCVYLCLRCGDAIAALDTLKSTSVGDVVEPAIVELASLLAVSQEQHGSVWKINEISPQMESARRKVSDLYFRYKCTAISDKSDCYKAAALALMSVAEPVSHSTGVLPTVEDFMFATLWYALTSNSNTIDQVIKLGKKNQKRWTKPLRKRQSNEGLGIRVSIACIPTMGCSTETSS